MPSVYVHSGSKNNLSPRWLDRKSGLPYVSYFEDHTTTGNDSWNVSTRRVSIASFDLFVITCLTVVAVKSLTHTHAFLKGLFFILTHSERKLSVEHVGCIAEYHSMTKHFCVSDMWLKCHLAQCCWPSWCPTPSLSPVCVCICVCAHVFPFI